MQLLTVRAREILDSRGNPTVEVEASSAKASVQCRVPSGASTGAYEAKEIRDGGKRYNGKGVTRAVDAVNGPIAKLVTKQDFADQAALDHALIILDGTPDKSRLGANAILGVSMAYARLAAIEQGVPLWKYFSQIYGTTPRLPVIFANVINGGKHAGNGLAMQEFMIVSRAKRFDDQVEEIVRTYSALRQAIVRKYGAQATGVGDEGGFAPPVRTSEDALELLAEARRAAKTDVVFALDAAASEFYDPKNDQYAVSEGVVRSSGSLIDYYKDLVQRFGIVSVEDPFEENSFGDFAKLREAVAGMKIPVQIVGDDLTVSNPARVRDAIERHSCDCLLLKVNQIGTVTEAVQASQLATKAGWHVMVSHRSGETDDAFIAHLAVGLGTGQIKIGAPSRGERVAKYNELLRISESLNTYSPLF